MDQMRMDVEGGRAVRRKSRVGRLAVVVAVQNVLVVTCLLVTVYLYMATPVLRPENVYIQFQGIRDLRGNKSLEFSRIVEKHGLDLEPNKRNIKIRCQGPYIWHIYACYVGRTEVSGTLVLQVNNTNVSSIIMNATQAAVCRGLHSIVYLKNKDLASFHWYSPDNFALDNLTIGLSYMLGNKCYF